VGEGGEVLVGEAGFAAGSVGGRGGWGGEEVGGGGHGVVEERAASHPIIFSRKPSSSSSSSSLTPPKIIACFDVSTGARRERVECLHDVFSTIHPTRTSRLIHMHLLTHHEQWHVMSTDRQYRQRESRPARKTTPRQQ